MISYFPVVTGSLTVSGSVNISGGITASGGISISGSIASSSFASTASFVALAQSASNAVSAATASFANTLTVAGNLTAQTLVVQTITSSVDFVTGSTRFGSLLGNTHVFSGSVIMNPGGLFVSGSGRVGINTTNPLSLFDITVLTGGARRLLVNYDDSLVTIKSANDSATGESLRVWGDNIYFYTGSAGSELMRLTNTGRVGIGTTTPDGKLHVFGKTYARYGQDDMFAFYYDDNYRFGITNPSTDLRQLRVFGQAADGNSFIVFATNNNIERMRITTDGAMYMSRVNSNLTFADSVGGMYVRQDGNISGNAEELRIFGRNIGFYSHSGTRYASITSIGTLLMSATTISNNNAVFGASNNGGYQYFNGNLANGEKFGSQGGTYLQGFYFISWYSTSGRGYAIYATVSPAANAGTVLVSSGGWATSSATYNASSAISLAYDGSSRGPVLSNNTGTTVTFYSYVFGGS